MAVKTLKVLSAYDEQLIEELPLASPQDASRMLTAARKLADDPKKRLPIPERIEILEKAQEILKQRYDEIVQTAATEGGKPFTDTQVEITRSINGGGFRHGAGSRRRRVVPRHHGRNARLLRAGRRTDRTKAAGQIPADGGLSAAAGGKPAQCLVLEV